MHIASRFCVRTRIAIAAESRLHVLQDGGRWYDVILNYVTARGLFLCLHGVVAMVAVPSGYKLVISRATLGMHGIYCTQPSGMRPRASVQ